MVTAITFALLSLFFSGLNDVLFKRYSAKERSRGMLISGIGVIWLLLQTLTLLTQGTTPAVDAASLGYGLVCGVILVLSNLLLVECLTHIEASTGSTIYRLNTVGVVLLSLLFLGEQLNSTRAGGVLCAIAAVLLLIRRDTPGAHASHYRLFIGLMICASLLRAGYGVLTKIALNHNADAATLMLLSALCWTLGGALYAGIREKRFILTRKKAAYAAASGVFVWLIVNFLLAAVARADASLVIPIANLGFVATLLISAALGMEALTRRKLAAITCAGLAIGLLSWH